MPYNYILDPTIRKSLKISIKDDILIIDEAHNIAQMIEETNSFILTKNTFKRVIKEIKSIENAIWKLD